LLKKVLALTRITAVPKKKQKELKGGSHSKKTTRRRSGRRPKGFSFPGRTSSGRHRGEKRTISREKKKTLWKLPTKIYHAAYK